MEFNIAFIGFGVVGQGFAEILLEQENELKENHNFEYKVVANSDTMKGSVYDENGLDIKKLLEREFSVLTYSKLPLSATSQELSERTFIARLKNDKVNT